MSENETRVEPAFRMNEQQVEYAPQPVNKLAVVAAGLGVFSLIAILAPKVALVSAVAATLGLVAFAVSSYRADKVGANVALVGIALGTLSGVWSLVASSRENAYYYAEAGRHAEHFLEVLASGRKYQAFELTHIEPNRQITGTRLEEYYNGLVDEDAEPILAFLRDQNTNYVVEAGPKAEWNYVGPVSIKGPRTLVEVVVELQSSDPNLRPLHVRMQRSVGLMLGENRDATALWNVVGIEPESSVGSGD